MKIPIPQAGPLFAADIDVSLIEDFGISITSIDELVLLIQTTLKSDHINGALTKDVITGDRAKPVYELLLSEEVGFGRVLTAIRQALESRGIDWHEPYAEYPETTEFRFITPTIGIFRT